MAAASSHGPSARSGAVAESPSTRAPVTGGAAWGIGSWRPSSARCRPFSGPYSPGGCRGETRCWRSASAADRSRPAAAATASHSRPASRPVPARVRSAPGTPAERATSRRSMSTNRPDSGRLDQSALAVTWNSTMRPAPRALCVTSGVPSAKVAQVCCGQVGRGLGQHLPVHLHLVRHGEAGERRGVGELRQPGRLAQDSAPPSWRSPLSSFTGISGSVSPNGCSAVRGPAKRISSPPCSTHLASASRSSPAGSGRSARTSTEHRAAAGSRDRPRAPRCTAPARDADSRAGRRTAYRRWRVRRPAAHRPPPPALVEQHHRGGTGRPFQHQPAQPVAQFGRQCDRRGARRWRRPAGPMSRGPGCGHRRSAPARRPGRHGWGTWRPAPTSRSASSVGGSSRRAGARRSAFRSPPRRRASASANWEKSPPWVSPSRQVDRPRIRAVARRAALRGGRAVRRPRLGLQRCDAGAQIGDRQRCGDLRAAPAPPARSPEAPPAGRRVRRGRARCWRPASGAASRRPTPSHCPPPAAPAQCRAAPSRRPAPAVPAPGSPAPPRPCAAASSHQGVRAGVSSRACSPISRRIAGNTRCVAPVGSPAAATTTAAARPAPAAPRERQRS